MIPVMPMIVTVIAVAVMTSRVSGNRRSGYGEGGTVPLWLPTRLAAAGKDQPLPKKTWIAAAAVAVLAIAGGAAFVATYAPAKRMAEDTLFGERLREERQVIADPLTTDHWKKTDRADKGVTIWDPLNAERGFTLYTSGEGAVARLISMTGSKVHEWSIPYSKVWKRDAAAVQDPQPDNLIFLRQARLLPNGDLIAIYEAAGHVPSGYGMVKVDKTSAPLWSYLQRVHGGFDMAPDGRIFALTQSIREDKMPAIALKPPFMEDFLVVLSADGKETAKLSLVEALARSRYASLLKQPADPIQADPLGTNSVQYMGDVDVKGVPGDNAGRVLVSFGALGVIAVVDMDSRQVIWATKGAWKGQREADALPEGDILLVDSPTGAPGKGARAMQVDPSVMSVTWTYTGQADQPFSNAVRSSAQRLSNGNTLLTEAGAGRLFEVDRNGTVVWEYTNPVRAGQGGAYIPIIASGQRIAAYSLDSSFRGFTRP